MLTLGASNPKALYLHIPFCTTRCSYCAFYSEPRPSWKGFQERYVARLEQEITDVVQETGGFETIFIGGGNPGSLTEVQLSRLLVAAKSIRCSEVTIEMNPETFSESYFPLFEKKLVTRLSMGIQSMDDSVLRQLGRNATVEDNLRAIALAKKAHDLYGIDLSFDLMAALPGQSIKMALQDIDTVVSLSDPSHISLYCLTVEEGTELARRVSQRELKVWDDDGQMVFLQNLWNRLGRLGYEHYEVSNFAREGRYCKHNLMYWNLDTYLGLGSSAASFLQSESHAWHYSQKEDLHSFAEGTLFGGYEKEWIGSDQLVEEYLMMALRTNRGIEKNLFKARFSLDFDSLFSKTVPQLDPLWYKNTPHLFVLSQVGWMVLDEIVLRLALQIPQPLDRH